MYHESEHPSGICDLDCHSPWTEDLLDIKHINAQESWRWNFNLSDWDLQEPSAAHAWWPHRNLGPNGHLIMGLNLILEPWGCMWPVCALCVVFFNCVLHAVTAVDRKIWLGWTVGLEFVLHPSNKVRCKLSVCEVFSKCPKTYNENMSQLSLNFKQCLKQRKRVSTTFSQPLLPASWGRDSQFVDFQYFNWSRKSMKIQQLSFNQKGFRRDAGLGQNWPFLVFTVAIHFLGFWDCWSIWPTPRPRPRST